MGSTIVHGKTIELVEDPGVAEGHEVEIQMKLIPPPKKWGEGILRSAGGWAHYPEMDAIMQKIQRKRKLERRSQKEDSSQPRLPCERNNTSKGWLTSSSSDRGLSNS